MASNVVLFALNVSPSCFRRLLPVTSFRLLAILDVSAKLILSLHQGERVLGLGVISVGHSPGLCGYMHSFYNVQ